MQLLFRLDLGMLYAVQNLTHIEDGNLQPLFCGIFVALVTSLWKESFTRGFKYIFMNCAFAYLHVNFHISVFVDETYKFQGLSLNNVFTSFCCSWIGGRVVHNKAFGLHWNPKWKIMVTFQ